MWQYAVENKSIGLVQLGAVGTRDDALTRLSEEVRRCCSARPGLTEDVMASIRARGSGAASGMTYSLRDLDLPPGRIDFVPDPPNRLIRVADAFVDPTEVVAVVPWADPGEDGCVVALRTGSTVSIRLPAETVARTLGLYAGDAP